MSVKTNLGNVSKIKLNYNWKNIRKIWYGGRFWYDKDSQSIILYFNNTYGSPYPFNFGNTSGITARYLDDVFYGSNMGTITIPPGIHKVNLIGSNIQLGYAGGFDQMRACLTEVIFATNTTLQSYAFQDCTALQKVTILSSMTTLYDQPFKNCTSLTNIYFYPTTTTRTCTSYNNSWFYGCDQYCIIHASRNLGDISASNAFGAWWRAYSGTTNFTRKNLNTTYDL